MDRLGVFLSLLSGSLITVALTVAAFSMGYSSWFWVVLCVVFGFAMAWPSGYYISRLLRRNDRSRRRDPKE